MNSQISFKTVKAITAVAALSVSYAYGTAISIDNISWGLGPGGSGNRTIETAFDASGSDKLVVVLGGEHGFGGNTGGDWNSVTYGGTSLVRAAHEGSAQATLGIFYLDNPGAAGDIVVNQANMNGSIRSIYLLSGTAAGHVSANTATSPTVALTTTGNSLLGDPSLVIAGHHNAGVNGGNFVNDVSTIGSLNEDTPFLALGGGRRWNSLSTGQQFFSTAGPQNFAWTVDQAGDSIATGAIEFAAYVPEPSSTALLGLGGLAFILRRRR